MGSGSGFGFGFGFGLGSGFGFGGYRPSELRGCAAVVHDADGLGDGRGADGCRRPREDLVRVRVRVGVRARVRVGVRANTIPNRALTQA